MSNRSPRIAWLFWFLLLLQNYLIFRGHYQGRFGFPWDFPMSYHAFIYYWTTVVGLGHFPAWVPFQALGYPFGMNLQSGVAYPPLWLFCLFKIPYTMHAATIFQCLHVLGGSFGAYWLARRQQLSPSASFFVAVCYQGFGGFYCHAEHSDIVRSYALLPWLLGAVMSPSGRSKGIDAARVVGTPIAFALLVTGGYPGATMAAMFMLVVGVSCAAIDRRHPWHHILNSGLLLGLGYLIASPLFLAPFLLRNEIGHYSQYAKQVVFLPPIYLLTLIQGCDYPGLSKWDVSLRSLFVGIPVLTLLFFVTRESVKAFRLWLILALVAGLMIFGTPVYQVVTTLLPPLELSSFPIADYRLFIAIPLFLLGAHILERFERLSNLRMGGGFLLMALATGATLYLLAITPVNYPKQFYGTLLIMIGTFAVLFYYRAQKLTPFVLALLLALLAFLDANRVLQDEPRYWKSPEIEQWHRDGIGSDLSSPSPQLRERVSPGVTRRPPRIKTSSDHDFAFRGYMTGDYMARDYSGGMQLKRQQMIVNDALLFDYATQASRADLFPAGRLPGREEVGQLPKNGGQGSVELYLYGPEVLRHKINLANPMLMLENETYFPGWRAILSDGTILEPKDCLGFRAWELPAGYYTMEEKFTMPYRAVSLLLGLTGIVIWAIMVAVVVGCKKRFWPE